MRQIGTLSDPQQAQRFCDYLLAQGIKTKVDAGTDGSDIWIRDEDQLERARVELEQFRAAPDDPRYAGASRQARQVRAEEAAFAKRYRKNQIDVRGRWAGAMAGRRGRLTMVLIGISVAVSLLTNLGSPENAESLGGQIYLNCHISNYKFAPGAPWNVQLPEIQHGQLWRLVTPIFLHFSWMHLIFNMLWLIDLGSMIESHRGTLRFGVLVLAIAVISNLAQYVTGGPYFGGMSGVVYGLFGYIWMKSRYDPGSGLYLTQNTVRWMLIFFALCFTGLVGPVANTAHGVGLAVGVIVGVAPHLLKR